MKLLSPRRAFLSHVFLYSLIIITISKCNKFETALPANQSQPILNSEELKRLVLLDTSFVYPIALATNDAKMIALELDKKDKLNSTPRTIKKVLTVNVPDKLLSSKQAKSNTGSENVPEVYVFNFDDNRGFALISADERALGILGAAPGGTIDSLVNPAMGSFLASTLPYIQQRRAATEALRDSIFDGLIVKLGFKTVTNNISDGRVADNIHSCPGGTATTITARSTSYVPLVNSLISTQWDQYAPYNDNYYQASCSYAGYCGNVNGNYSAGCIPIATSQVIAYFNAKTSTDWQRIVSTPDGAVCNLGQSDIAAVATLVRRVFDAYVCSTGCHETGCGTYLSTGSVAINPSNGLHNGEFRNYNLTDVTNSLAQGSPLIINGFTDLCCFILCLPYGCGESHYWIIDGQQNAITTTTYHVTGNNIFTCAKVDYTYTSSTSATQLHYNWGWGPGAGNGWFQEGTFQTSPNPNFSHNVQIIAYISPI